MYLEQLVSTEQLAAATDGSLRKNGADVMMPTVGFQADAQPAALTKLLHLSHLSWKPHLGEHFVLLLTLTELQI